LNARGFLYNLASLLKLIGSQRNNLLVSEIFQYDNEKKHLPKRKCGVFLSNERKSKKNPKIPPEDHIGGRFYV